jgi:1,4-dihydroxy-2-naphthoate octaprenyltransferase
MDYYSDKQSEKKTLPVLIHNPKILFCFFCLLNLTPFLLIGYGIVVKHLSLAYSLLFLVMPLSGYLMYSLVIFSKHSQKKIKLHFWMGFMEHWDKIEKAGIDQFMLRWYLARNITVFFCLLAMISSLL